MERSLKKPKVSIIIPTYNSQNTFSECLESVFNQSYPLYEVIVVDNFSNDDTVKIAEGFKTRVLQRRCSPAAARNIGIVNSAGKYTLFLDSDQVLSASVIAECVEKCENGRSGMVHIPEVFIGRGFWSSCSAVWKNCYAVVENSVAVGDFVSEPRFFVKEHISHTGMLDAHLRWGEDYELYSRLRKMGIKEVTCKSKIYHYEPASIKSLLVKNFRYGESMPTFTQKTRKQVMPLLFQNAMLTFRKVLRDFKKSPAIIAGCAVLLYLKTCSMMMGLIISFIGRLLK